MNAPSVSVLVTAFNREHYLRASLDSVLAQWHDDFEVVIVDDQSTDGTYDVALEYARRDGRIRVFRNERNLGDYPNRNRAASHARGRYLKYHDSDDVMYPHCLSVMVSALETMPEAGLGLSIGRAWTGGPSPMLLTPRMAYQREFLGMGMFMGGPACALIRRDVFERLGGFEDHGTPSDHVFWLRACARVPVALLPGDLFFYRVHPGQSVAGGRAELEYARAGRLVWRALEAAECPLGPGERDRARRRFAWETGRLVLRDIRARRWGLAALRLTHSGLTAGDWLRYFRVQRRQALAGTPLGPDGDYPVPAWVRPPAPGMDALPGGADTGNEADS